MTKRAILIALVAAAGMVSSPQANAQTNGEKLDITAWAVNMSNIGTGSTATVDFTVSRWSTPDERERLITTMVDKGQDALLKALQKMPSHGRMRFPAWKGPDPLNARLGWDIRYAWQTTDPDGGRRIVLALDRYLSFWEAANRPRSVDYPFTLVEMRVDKNGEGEGKLSVATKINVDRKNKVLELETYASEPVHLEKVKVTPRT